MEQLLHQLGQQWQSVVDFFAFDTALLGEPDMIVRIVAQLFLLVCSAFLSSSETALFSLSRLDLQQLRRERNPRAETIHELLDQPRRLIISILSGNELINIAASVNMTGILVTLYGGANAGWINLIVMVPLLLVFCEVTPKTIAVNNPVRYSSRIVAAPLKLWIELISPLVWVIRGIADRITTLFVGEIKTADNILHVDEFLTLVEQVSEEGVLDATERALIYNLLDAGETEIVEVMTPRTQMAFINIDMPFPEVVAKFITYRHPRVPVFRTHRDNLVGFLHAEDILRLKLDNADFSAMTIEDVMHPPVVVPLTKKVDEMFDFFQQHRVRAAACLNEFGGVDGFITMRGVLSFIFGDISGGTAATAGLYAEQDHNIYEVPGEMRLTDFDDLTNFGIEDPRMTTIAGVAFRLLDRLPQVGDRVELDDILLEVLEMDEHRIARVRVGKGVDLDEFIRADDVHITAQEDLVDQTIDRPEPEDVEEGMDDEDVASEEEDEHLNEEDESDASRRTGTDQ